MKGSFSHRSVNRNDLWLWFLLGFLLALVAALPSSAQEILFEDDFDGPSLDAQTWGIGTWNLGSRTRLGKQPVFGSEGETGYLTLILDTYDPSFPGSKLLGTEIYSKSNYARLEGLELEARVRVRTETGGMICSFFTYTENAGYSDEIDFEYMTTRPADRVLLSTWNQWHWSYTTYDDGIHNSTEEVVLPGLDRSQWNVLTIRWLPDRTEWLVNGVVVRTTGEALPDDPMPVRSNLWAAGSEWTEAYNAALQPVSNQAQNSSYFYDIDYIRLTRLGSSPTPPAAPQNLIGNVAGTTVNLSWQDASNNETGFQVYRALKPKRGVPNFSLRATVGANTSAYSESPGRDVWLYKVRAVNGTGASADSNTVQVRVR